MSLLLFWKEAGQAPVTGSLAKTLANVTQSSAAKVVAKGSLSKSLNNASLAATATVTTAPVSGALSKTLGNLALVSTSKVLATGTANVQLQGVTSPAVGHVPVKADEQRTLQSATLAATAQITTSGSVSQSLDGLTLEATATVPAVPVLCVVSTSLADATLAAAVVIPIRGSVGVTLESVHGMSPVAQAVVIGRSAGGVGYRGNVGKLTGAEWDKARKAFAKARRKRRELEAKTNPKALKQLASAVSRETQAYEALASIDAIKAAAFKADAAVFYANEEDELMFILAMAA